MTLETSPDKPAPLRQISSLIHDWIARMGAVWVEGQVTEIKLRGGNSQVYIKVRDVEENVTIQMVTSPGALEAVQPPLQDGARIVMHARPEFWTSRGSLVLRARELRAVGLGDLLARIEVLRQALSKEGLFDRERKQPLPFLPRRVGLICGRGSAAEKDVVENAIRRWPSIEFEIREVPVQGATAAKEVTQALAELDSLDTVDVIVITRGGGSVEDLLPFSDETLVRTAAACRTPIVSAIGHEQDSPLLDFVADFRASTPTDAAARIVPDLTEELADLSAMRQRALRAIDGRLRTEEHLIARIASHPGLADPSEMLTEQGEKVAAARDRCARALANLLQQASTSIEHLRTQLRTVSPAGTLERGYAIVTLADRRVLRQPDEVQPADQLEIRIHGGAIGATVTTSPLPTNEGTDV